MPNHLSQIRLLKLESALTNIAEIAETSEGGAAKFYGMLARKALGSKESDKDAMTPDQFKAARKALSLSQRQLAGVWSMGKNGERTIRRWEQGDTPVNPVAAYCIQMMLDEAERAA